MYSKSYVTILLAVCSNISMKNVIKCFKSVKLLNVKSVKRGTHLGFNAIRVLKKNVLTFCLHKVLIKCRVSIRKSSIWFYIDSAVQ